MGGARYINLESVQNPEMLVKLLEAFDEEMDTIRTLVNELKTDMSEHVHGGVTTGSGDTSAGAAIAAAAVVEKVISGT